MDLAVGSEGLRRFDEGFTSPLHGEQTPALEFDDQGRCSPGKSAQTLKRPPKRYREEAEHRKHLRKVTDSPNCTHRRVIVRRTA
jgi:hypothetical protein